MRPGEALNARPTLEPAAFGRQRARSRQPGLRDDGRNPYVGYDVTAAPFLSS